ALVREKPLEKRFSVHGRGREPHAGRPPSGAPRMGAPRRGSVDGQTGSPVLPLGIPGTVRELQRSRRLEGGSLPANRSDHRRRRPRGEGTADAGCDPYPVLDRKIIPYPVVLFFRFPFPLGWVASRLALRASIRSTTFSGRDSGASTISSPRIFLSMTASRDSR